MAARYPHLAAASWNRVVATLGSFFAYTTRQGWTPTSPAVGLERHRHRLDRDAHARSRAIPAADLLAFLNLRPGGCGLSLADDRRDVAQLGQHPTGGEVPSAGPESALPRRGSRPR